MYKALLFFLLFACVVIFHFTEAATKKIDIPAGASDAENRGFIHNWWNKHVGLLPPGK